MMLRNITSFLISSSFLLILSSFIFSLWKRSYSIIMCWSQASILILMFFNSISMFRWDFYILNLVSSSSSFKIFSIGFSLHIYLAISSLIFFGSVIANPLLIKFLKLFVTSKFSVFHFYIKPARSLYLLK
jgi:hypothetical protein